MSDQRYVYVIDNGKDTIYDLSVKEILNMPNVETVLNELDNEVKLLCKFMLSKGYTLDDYNEWLVNEEWDL